jgi:hypothetical protein
MVCAPAHGEGLSIEFCEFRDTRRCLLLPRQSSDSESLAIDMANRPITFYKPTFRYRSERPGVALGSEPRPHPTGSCPGVIWCLMGPQRDEHRAAADGLFCRYFFLHDIQMLYEFSTNYAKDVGARRRVQYRLVYTISGRAKFRSGPHLAEIVAPPETVTDSRTTAAKESGGSRRPTPSELRQATGGV